MVTLVEQLAIYLLAYLAMVTLVEQLAPLLLAYLAMVTLVQHLAVLVLLRHEPLCAVVSTPISAEHAAQLATASVHFLTLDAVAEPQ